MFDIVFLGTGAMKPTPKRFTSSLMLRHKKETIMFDVGEGTQIRVAQSGFSPMKVGKIFITHFHGDHFYGLPGIIFTMSNSERKTPLTIYGPTGAKKFIQQILTLGYGQVPFEVNVEELSNGDQIKGDGYTITAFDVDHGPPSLGYLFKEDDDFSIDTDKMKKYGLTSHPKFKLLKKGETIEIDGKTLKPKDWLIPIKGDSMVYTGDTRPCENTVNMAKGATILIHESTHVSGDIEEDRGHSSAKEAAEVAKKAGVGTLILIHISSRYLDTTPLLDEAKKVFPNVYLPNDLTKVMVKKGELTVQ
ncbi:MAG: ribonuclease Z [Candidatus Altiarchaeota archaeon]|nr:ribonuclease Z [Candidatus Altiarchaeota archaeon]